MIDFGVDIKIEGSTSEQAVKRVTVELERNERAAKAAKEAVKQGMAEGTIAADKEAEAVRRLTREFASSERAMEEGLRATQTQFQQLNSSVRSVTQQLGEFGLAGNAVMGFATTLEHAGTAMMRLHIDTLMLGDGLIEMRNRLRAAGVASGDLSNMMARVHQVADRSLTSIGSTIDAYTRVKNATSELGFTQTRALAFTETLNKAFATSGRSTGEAAAAMLQFSQALGSGVLQGDEFRSIAENAPFLLDAFAAKLHVTRGALKELSSQGKISTDIMVSAIEGMAAKTDAAFAQMERTFSQRMQPVFSEIEADPFGFRKTATNAANADPTAIFDLYKTINKGGPDLVPGLSSVASALGVELPTTEVSEFNKQIGYMTDTIKQLAEAYGWKAKPELGSFEEQLKDLVEASLPFTNHFRTVEEQLRNVGAAAKDAGDGFGTLIGGFKQFGQNIGVKFLPGFFDPWNHSLDDATKKTHAAAKKMHDGFADSFVSPTLVQIDMLIAKLKLLIEVQNDAARAAGLRDLGVAQPGLRGGLPTGAENEADMLLMRVNQRKQGATDRDAYAASQRRESFWQSLFGTTQTGERNGNAFKADMVGGKLTEEGQLQAALYTKRWTQELEENRKAWGDVKNAADQAQQQIESNFVRMFETGRSSWKALFSELLHDFNQLAVHRLFTGIFGGSLASAIGAAPPDGVPHAAHGWSGTIGGNSYSGDRVPLLMMVNSGEHVQVTPQGQGSGGGSASVSNQIVFDPRSFTKMIGTRAGRREQLETFRIHRNEIRQILGI